MAELEKLHIPHERLRLSQAAGFEPLAAPDEQFPGGGYARVEVSLLNETTGVKVAQHGGATKARVKVTETNHAPQHGAPPSAGSHDKKSDAHAAPSAGKQAADGHSSSPAASKGH